MGNAAPLNDAPVTAAPSLVAGLSTYARLQNSVVHFFHGRTSSSSFLFLSFLFEGKRLLKHGATFGRIVVLDNEHTIVLDNEHTPSQSVTHK